MGTLAGAARLYVANTIREHAPKGWSVVDTLENLDALKSVTVVVSVSRIARAAEAPMGAYDTTALVSLVSPITDNLERAELELEEHIGELLTILERKLGIAWEPAELRLFRDRNLTWDIPVHVITSRED